MITRGGAVGPLAYYGLSEWVQRGYYNQLTYQRTRKWFQTTLATFYPLVTNSLVKTVKVPTRCALAVKQLNTLSGMPYSAHTLLLHRKGNVCSTDMSASNDVPVPLVSSPQGGGWKGQWRRRSSGTRLGVEWVDPKELFLYQLQTLIKEWGTRPLLQWSFRQTCISSKRPGHFWLACYSICLGPRTEKPLMAPQLASQHNTVAHQRGVQQVCPTSALSRSS